MENALREEFPDRKIQALNVRGFDEVVAVDCVTLHRAGDHVAVVARGGSQHAETWDGTLRLVRRLLRGQS